MEPAKIDWKNINSVFVVDDVYEHINAPKWVDFLAPDQSLDDASWFCRPDCNHPKTVEDFLIATPPKLQRSASVPEILPLGDRNRSDANLKRRGLAQASALSGKDLKCDKFVEDGENQNPNFYTTPSHQYNIMKEVIKSSTEKRQIDTPTRKEETPRLKSTLSARNLFGGRDILNQITEFCNELKRLAARVKARENVEKMDVKQSLVAVKRPKTKECGGDNLRELDEREEERKPLVEVSKEKCDAMERSNVKEKQRRKKRADEVENIPILLDLNNVQRKERENLLQIRTCPPSPQCFSANRGPSKASTPLKGSRTRPQERGILLELEQSNTELRKEESADNNNTPGRSSAAVVADNEARTLDIFWFLKPCTLSLSS